MRERRYKNEQYGVEYFWTVASRSEGCVGNKKGAGEGKVKSREEREAIACWTFPGGWPPRGGSESYRTLNSEMYLP